eukprot:TRINITY_DN12719_c0_g2_i1.p1 TRINITY_DN12719_c0_g2~~TRINITY_DN12719_c0_g2_i1.p1  ORF type:complete len:125 (+),score=18.92 TRINITY_DN12719_c0_g2_i1:72-446(+)
MRRAALLAFKPRLRSARRIHEELVAALSNGPTALRSVDAHKLVIREVGLNEAGTTADVTWYTASPADAKALQQAIESRVPQLRYHIGQTVPGARVPTLNFIYIGQHDTALDARWEEVRKRGDIP